MRNECSAAVWTAPCAVPPRLAGTLSQLVGVDLDGLRHLVEQFVHGDEGRPTHIPMRLFDLTVQIDGGRQTLVQQFDGLLAGGFAQRVVCCLRDCISGMGRVSATALP